MRRLAGGGAELGILPTPPASTLQTLATFEARSHLLFHAVTVSGCTRLDAPVDPVVNVFGEVVGDGPLVS